MTVAATTDTLRIPLSPTLVPVSATLAAHEMLIRKRQAGEPVLPLAFGEAGLPVPPVLLTGLGAVTGGNGWGRGGGGPPLREAAAGYWTRRGLPTSADDVVSGPGSKPLLFALLLALGTDVALPRPSWVSYAAQATMIGSRAQPVPVPNGEGGICDPAALADVAVRARRAGRPIRPATVTLPHNPPPPPPHPPTLP